MKMNIKKRPLMVLGTSSGSGKSLITTAICRLLKREGKKPLPFKGQNMSNNAWVDKNGGEMAYSQAVQAWACGEEPTCEMNPILLKPKGDCTSEVIHLGNSVGYSNALNYYEYWNESGWVAIKNGLEKLILSNKNAQLVLEGAGSPVEINLKHKDLTNLKLAKFLNADCIIVADIERGGVFAQIIGTLALLKPEEKKLIKGIIINRFRGEVSLFESGREWLEKETGIPILGIMPWINEIFPPEDSLDLLEIKSIKPKAEIEIAVIRLPSLSNFSDLDPLFFEDTVQVRWVDFSQELGCPDLVLLPGSKQTINDLETLKNTNLANQIIAFAKNGGNVFGICGGLQILGKTLEDPLDLEKSQKSSQSKIVKGLNLLPLHTVFESKKNLRQRKEIVTWPNSMEISGFELHHGTTNLIPVKQENIKSMFRDSSLGWIKKGSKENFIGGTYLHGIFENGVWRRKWINQIRESKGLKKISTNKLNHKITREKSINLLADIFEKHINIKRII